MVLDGNCLVRAFRKIPEAILILKGAVPAPALAGRTRRPPDVVASEDFRANGYGGPVTFPRTR